MKRALGIVRVSSQEQAKDERFSIPHQKAHIAEECHRKGMDLVHVLEFVQSGAKVLRSTGKEREIILNFISQNDIEAVIVHELDRLARSMLDTLLFVDELNKRKIVFMSVHDGFDTSTAQGQLQMQILAAFAEYFRAQLAAKVLGGMTERASQGKPMGRRPFGYRFGKDNYIVDEEEATVVKWIFNAYVKENMGLRAIAEALNKQGLRTPAGMAWSHVSVRQILDHDIYTGVFKWKDICLIDAIPKIIDRELFDQAHNRRKRKRELGGRSQNATHLLSGLLRCGICGGPLVGTMRNNKYRAVNGDVHVYTNNFYRCQNYASRGRSICPAGEFAGKDLEQLVVTDLLEMISSVKSVAYQQGITRFIQPSEKEMLENQLTIKKRELTRLENMLLRAAEAFEAGEYDLDFFRKRKEAITDQKNAVAGEIAQLEHDLDSGLSERDIAARVQKLLESHHGILKVLEEVKNIEDLGEEAKKQLKMVLQQIVDKIEVKKDEDGNVNVEVYYML